MGAEATPVFELHMPRAMDLGAPPRVIEGDERAAVRADAAEGCQGDSPERDSDPGIDPR